MSIRKLAGQTAIYGISSIVTRLLNYLLTPYLTRIMTEAEYGVVVDMYALIPFVLVVLTMGMETGYFKFAGGAKTTEEKRNVFSTAWGTVTVASMLFLGIVLLFLGNIAGFMGYADRSSFVWIAAVIIALDAIIAVPLARLREQGRAYRYVAVRVVSVVVNIILCVFFYSILPVLASKGYAASIYDIGFQPGYYLVANLIASGVALAMVLPGSWKSGMKIKLSVAKTMLLYSLPLLLSGIAGTANEYIDRQMIKYLLPAGESMEALGVYGAVVKIGVILLMFIQMYRLGAEPYFLSGLDKDDFKRTNAVAMKYFVMVSVLIFLGIMLFSDVFALLVGPAFRQGMFILPIVLLGNIFAGIAFNLSFWYKQMSKTHFALLVTGTGLVFTVVFNILLVPRLGYFGAALARLICEFAMVAVSYVLNRKYCPTPYDLKHIAVFFIAGGIIYSIGLGTGHFPAVYKYLCNLALLFIYIMIVVKLEKIDVKKLILRR